MICDEFWKHTPDAAADVMAAVSPTQATRPGAQIVIASAMGTAASTGFHQWVDRGRAGDPAVSIIEYGIGDDGNPDDIDEILARHPGVHQLDCPADCRDHITSRAFIEAERASLPRNEFARAYGNARTQSDARFIPPAVWLAAATVDELPDALPAFGFAVSEDRSRSAILACVGGLVEVVASRPGLDWLAPAIEALAATYSGAAFAYEPSGPTATVADGLGELAGLLPLKIRDYATACVDLVDKLGQLDGAGVPAVRHRRNANLDAAADAAVPGKAGDGLWRWARRRSGGPIPELEAMTCAVWADTHRPAIAAAPRLYMG